MSHGMTLASNTTEYEPLSEFDREWFNFLHSLTLSEGRRYIIQNESEFHAEVEAGKCSISDILTRGKAYYATLTPRAFKEEGNADTHSRKVEE